MLIKKIIKFFLIFAVSSFFFNTTFANECSVKPNLKIGIIDNFYKDYKYYLYYTLGEYSSIKSIDFEVSKIENNIDEFDIVFGEYYDLMKLSHKEPNQSNKIKNFYLSNGIELRNNIYPLDLDTYILISKENSQNLNLEDLSNYFLSTKYTLGMSFNPINNFIKLFTYTLNNKVDDLNNTSVLLNLSLFNKTFTNMNKYILMSNYEEVYNSYDFNENIFTMFDDGSLLYENLNYSSFQLFPKSKYKWNSDKGYYEINNDIEPTSFYGFSAYLNNNNQSGFICYLIENDIRTSAFTKFNLGISPLSSQEIQHFRDNIPEKYLKILDIKNQNIFEYNFEDNVSNYKILIDIINNKKKYESIFNSYDYLN